MHSSTQALIELERVQQHQPSAFWLERCEDPLRMQNWQELALASTAWSWMDAEPAPPSSPVWKKLWDQALTWPVNDELAYVEQAVVAWSEYPVWNSVRSMKLIQTMEKAKPRDWSSLMLAQDLQPQRFAFHLLHAVCLHPDKFVEINLATMWETVLNTPGLRPDLKEVLVVSLLKSSENSWKSIASTLPTELQDGTIPTQWMEEFKEKMPHRASWLVDFELLQANLGVDTIHRSVLAGQWDILLNKSQWEKQAKSYEMFDFAEGAPGFF